MSQAPAVAQPADAPRQSPWAPLSHPTFRALWTANLVSDIGGAMHAVGAGWLMTQMAPAPLIVALVQAATMLPMFLLLLPAGAMGDIFDRRRLLIIAQTWSLIGAAVLGVVTLAGWIGPVSLLMLTLLLGVGAALATPSFQATVPELVPREKLSAAVSLSSMGVNIARAVGPALAGVLISTAGVAVVFLFNAASFVLVIIVLTRWKREARVNTLPAEPLLSALRTGWRYAAHNASFRAVLIRSASFFSFAAALWALLPLVGADRMQGTNGYAILLSCLGLGAVVGALTLPKLRLKLSSDRISFIGTLLFAGATIVAGLVENFYVIALAMLPAGWAWLANLTTFNITARFSIADWVMSRGLALNQMVFFGCQTLAALVWGQIAQVSSVYIALTVAGAAMVAAMLTGLRFKLVTPAKTDLQVSNHWAEPIVVLKDPNERGPVVTLIEYQINPADAERFLEAIQELAVSRERNGGYAWGIYEDMAKPGTYVEQFFSHSWLEHLRQHERTTLADKALQDAVNAFHTLAEPPRVSHLSAPGTGTVRSERRTEEL
jgi:MFS family permease